MKRYTEHEVRERLEELAFEHGSQKALALAAGVTEALVSSMIRGHKVPGGRVLAFMGMERVTITYYRRKR